MKSIKTHRQLWFIALALLASFNQAAAQGTAFTYQGRLNSSGSSANGNYDFTFALFPNSTGSSGQIGGTLTNLDVGVTNGLFTVTLDFGANFPGASRWLAIGVRTNGGASFTPLTPLQQLTPTPYAIYAPNAGVSASASSVAASNISGAIPLGQLPAAVLTNGEAGVTLTGSFTGNGGGLTNIADWHLAGNTGTTSNNYLGTTDNQPLQIRVGGAQAGLITPSNGSPNIVFGAAQNVISNGTYGASILGGSNNIIAATANLSTIGGGNQNLILGAANNSVVAGGSFNSISNSADYSVVAGGENNSFWPNASFGFIGSGTGNSIQNSSFYSVLGGGFGNILGPFAPYSFMGGGGDNLVQTGNSYSFLGGGLQNQILANANNSAIVGGQGNVIAASASSSFIGGGYENIASSTASFSVIGGGNENIISSGATMSFIGGGNLDNIQSSLSVVGGGSQNTISTSAALSFIGGGYQNNIQAGSSNSVLVGGFQNAVSNSATYAALGGGQGNFVTGKLATVPGGATNLASGQFSFAAGANAQAVHSGAFVWSDAEGTPFASTNTNSFNVRANGGVRFVTAGAGLTVDGAPLLAGNNGGSLTNLNASQLTSGTVPLAQLPGSVVTNNEPLVQLGTLFLVNNLQLGGKLTLPFPATVSAGVSTLLIADNNANSYFGPSAGGGSISGSGIYNTGIGYGALSANTTGSQNVAAGFSALGNSTGDGGLVAIGFQALQNDSAGNNGQTGDGNGHNTAIGYEALQADTFGAGNTATGYKALGQDTNGSFNTAMGDNALNANTSGSDNVAIGTAALQNNTGDNELVAIGFDALQNDNAGNNNQTSDGNGHNTAIGYEALQSDSGGVGNTGTGYKALQQNMSGSFNTAYGDGALSSSTGGSHNVGIGDGTLNSATGSGNIAIGSQAGGNVTSGGNNIYIGNAGAASENGIIRIGSTSTQTQTYLVGTVNVPVLNITGGSDLAEPFQIAGVEKDIPQGAVVVIDEANPGHLKMSDSPYDAHVAGVISGANGINPGIQMQQQGLLEGGRNVALTGRVYVQADASNGPIKPGDLLTTSSAPGRAMKVSDHVKAQGAILGKAMTGLKAGNGMVLVLVTLQ